MKNLKVHIAGGNAKLGRIPNISLPPIKSCGNCSGCKKECYALKAWKMYQNTRRAWNENFRLVREDPAAYFDQIDAWIAKHHPRLFRWHVSGDIPCQGYLEGMKMIAEHNPDTRFLAFTKMYDLDYSDLPENLSIVLSGWPGMELRNPHHLHVAWMQDGTEDRIPKNALECTGHCDHCGMCWALKEIDRDVFFYKH